ncbi:MAG: hypothetical protein ACP5VR_10855 [Acidimicrobiales bacterium]
MKRLRSPSLVGAAMVVATLSPWAAPSAPAATKPVIKPVGAVAVMDCGLGKPSVRPKSLVLACADANAEAVGLKWSSWGSAEAVAKGVYTWNLCLPYCAASKKWGRTAATLTLSDPVHTRQGWLFEQLTVRITGKVPAHMSRVQIYPEAPHR